MAVRTRSLFRAYEKIEKVLAGFLSFHQCMAEVERLSAGDLSPQLPADTLTIPGHAFHS
ncbi:MAG TPA: hypothetical protein VL157_10050 [Gemmatimonadaceae bacterium]|jgi:hypothetical protein|nr:hypothetical protein [Gemmatimonadaceae bacterium]